MNVFAFTQDGCKYLSDSHNDHDAITKIINASQKSVVADDIRNEIVSIGMIDDKTPEMFTKMDDLWNQYIAVIINILEESGCTIVWEN